MVLEMATSAYVTKNGLTVVSNRILMDYINDAYTDRLCKCRMWFDKDSDGEEESYIDVKAYIIEGEDDNVKPSYGSGSDNTYGTSYDTITLKLRFVIPERKVIYNGMSGEYETLTENIDIVRLELMTNNDIIFAKGVV